MSTYESKRVTLSYPAIEALRQIFNLPKDAPTQALASYLEQLIFQSSIQLTK